MRYCSCGRSKSASSCIFLCDLEFIYTAHSSLGRSVSLFLELMVRLFVGGLAHDTTSDQLASRFETFGKVTDCITIGPKGIEPFTKPGTTCRGFGYLSLEPANDSALRRCLTVV